MSDRRAALTERSTSKLAATRSAAASAVLSRALRLEKGNHEPASARQGAALTRVLHDLGLSSGTYRRMLQRRGSSAMAATADDFVDQYLEEMRPRDPVERMMATQLLWQHLRIGRLMELADQCATKPDLAKAYGAALDNAMGTFRRHAQALDGIRSPRPVQFIQDSQINMAQQQVVANAGAAGQNGRQHGANEQGSSPTRQAAVPPDARGPRELAEDDRSHAPVAPLDGAQDRVGQEPLVPEREEARPARRRGSRARSRHG